MAIIIEGMDNTGKSTLANLLASYLHLHVKESEGPPKSPSDLLDRVERYQLIRDTIFVRHPCISHNIYNTVRSQSFTLDVGKFYEQDHVFIYCARGLDGHEHRAKPHEDQAFVQAINEHKAALLALYDDWALEHANIIYRVGDPIKRIATWLST